MPDIDLASARKNRVAVVAAVCVAYAIAFAPLLVLPQGPWLIMMLAASSWPMALTAVVLAFIFASRVAEHPWRWAFSASFLAISLACLALQLFAGQGKLGLIGLPVAFLAPPLFVWAFRILKPAARPADS